MRVFKLIDAFISAALIIFFLIDYINHPLFDTLIQGYYIVGAWQTISMIIHALGRWLTRKYSCRYMYHWVTFISLVTFPLGSLWILLFTAPFMAVFYTILCFRECFVKIKRPLSLLKN
jgi:hypothetical protein